jgi:predicted kinase
VLPSGHTPAKGGELEQRDIAVGSDLPTLYVFSGLPASGKSTLSQHLATALHAVHLRIDTIEQALRDICRIDVEGEGYRLAYRIAMDNLRLGLDVVADSCNPIELTRGEWEDVARECRARCVNIEVICSDRDEHRARVERREPTIPGLRLPTWDEVERRQYESWTRERIVIDTAGRSTAACLAELLSKLAR